MVTGYFTHYTDLVFISRVVKIIFIFIFDRFGRYTAQSFRFGISFFFCHINRKTTIKLSGGAHKTNVFYQSPGILCCIRVCFKPFSMTTSSNF